MFTLHPVKHRRDPQSDTNLVLKSLVWDDKGYRRVKIRQWSVPFIKNKIIPVKGRPRQRLLDWTEEQRLRMHSPGAAVQQVLAVQMCRRADALDTEHDHMMQEGSTCRKWGLEIT